jgi:hypothetical protein
VHRPLKPALNQKTVLNQNCPFFALFEPKVLRPCPKFIANSSLQVRVRLWGGRVSSNLLAPRPTINGPGSSIPGPMCPRRHFLLRCVRCGQGRLCLALRPTVYGPGLSTKRRLPRPALPLLGVEVGLGKSLAKSGTMFPHNPGRPSYLSSAPPFRAGVSDDTPPARAG